MLLPTLRQIPGERSRSGQRLGPRSNRLEKDVIRTVWALLWDPLRRGWRRVARGVCWIVVWRDGDGNCGVGMTGGQARLRTVEEEN